MTIRRRFKDLAAWLLARGLPGRIMRDKRYFSLWERRGWHVTPVEYYSPIPDTRALPEELFGRRSDLIGVDLNLPRQLELLEAWKAGPAAECEKFPKLATAVPHAYYRENIWFQYMDAAALHCMIRSLRPRRVIEVGGGFSTFVTAAALERNRAEGHPCRLTTIEPYPNDELRRGFPGLSEVIETPVERVPLDFFLGLGENDILFIDSSHVVRTGGDVVYEYLEILPRLAKGVVIHAHDIQMPVDYHRDWIMEKRLFWSEQYLLQAFLAFNRAFEVLWAGSAMHMAHPAAICRAFPSYEPHNSWPGSFWMRKAE